jgi:hypothetical protein
MNKNEWTEFLWGAARGFCVGSVLGWIVLFLVMMRK